MFQSNPMPFEQPMANGEENDMLLGLDVMVEEEGEDNMAALLNDMFMWPPNSPRASPRRHDDDNNSREGSPARHAHSNATGHYAHNDDTQAVSHTQTHSLRALFIIFLFG